MFFILLFFNIFFIYSLNCYSKLVGTFSTKKIIYSADGATQNFKNPI